MTTHKGRLTTLWCFAAPDEAVFGRSCERGSGAKVYEYLLREMVNDLE